ncbi:MAG TPA: choice-of-anchor tandem repeat GloVer-containing protein [Bryobacteraceae bacterium]|nr:choice-of-anchor tandem repeat GloVer-containing protein [Bryobacteraceae bacterium]
MKSDGTIAVLHSFDGTDGAQPFGGLVQATDGSFYGTTYYGGTQSYGAIYKLSIGFGPFVKAVPRFATVGTAVTILGTDLTGATNVGFNGTAAVFTVVSGTEITTTVTSGATTGRIQVTVFGGTLSSARPFLVRP